MTDQKQSKLLRKQAEQLHHTLLTRTMRGDLRAARLVKRADMRYQRRKWMEKVLHLPPAKVLIASKPKERRRRVA